MKSAKFLVSSNGWEYTNKVKVKANTIMTAWTSEENRKYWEKYDVDYPPDGDMLFLDNVEITFGEPFMIDGGDE